jgi:uncharacterized protein (DUF2141 family)
MKKILLLLLLLNLTSFACAAENSTRSLTVKVENLRNAKGVVQFTLYDKEGSLPDEKFTRYLKKQVGQISNGIASVTFQDLPEGVYAVNILHDENSDGKIEKGFVMPVEGIGFSNYQAIRMTNRPDFAGASFQLNNDMEIEVKIIYM